MWVHQIVGPGLRDVGQGEVTLAVEQEFEHPRRRQRQFLDALSCCVRHRARDGRPSMGGDLGDRTAGARRPGDLYTPIAHDEVIGGRLDHLRGDLQQFLAHLVGRSEAGGTKRNGRAAAADSDIVACGIRVGCAPWGT
jgi:hypothetical protein